MSTYPIRSGFFMLLALYATGVIRDQRPNSCRSLDTQIWYAVSPMPDSPSKTALISDCDIVRVLPTRPDPTVTIGCPSGPSGTYVLVEIEMRREFTSADLGHSWHEELPLIPYSSTLPNRDLVQSPSDPRIQYRRLPEMGLYLRSEDAGDTWSLPGFNIEGESREKFLSRRGANKFYTVEFHLLAIHPREPKLLYARIGIQPWAAMIFLNRSLSNLDVHGIYESKDGGENWHVFSESSPGTTTLALSSAKPGLFYAQATGGILRSEDGGKQWVGVGQNELLKKPPLTEWDKDPEARERAAPHAFETYQLVLDPQDPQIVFIVSNKGFYRTMDGGKTWCLLNLGFDELGSANSLAINPERPADIFLGTSRGVFYSKDRGTHVEKIFPRPS